jgi:hypothetical protein
MLIPQLSVFVQDKVGRVAEICHLLAQQQVNIAGFDIADTAEGFGILHLVVDNTEMALQVLHDHHIVVKSVPIICVRMDNKPGQLARILSLLSEAKLNIEYMYLGSDNNMFIGTDQNEQAAAVLGGADFRILKASDLA